MSCPFLNYHRIVVPTHNDNNNENTEHDLAIEQKLLFWFRGMIMSFHCESPKSILAENPV